MKIVFALFLDYRVHNLARKLAFRIDAQFGTGLIASRLPQHVTLGPAITVDDIARVEEYFDRLARRTKPVKLHLTRIDLKIVPVGDGVGVIWIDLRQTDELRKLHNSIYAEIEDYGWTADALIGGEQYHFHSTIVMGGQPADVYRKIYDSIEEKELDMTCQADHMALICPEDEASRPGRYITYKILPLE